MKTIISHVPVSGASGSTAPGPHELGERSHLQSKSYGGC